MSETVDCLERPAESSTRDARPGGSISAASLPAEMWSIDFEFRITDGGFPLIACMVAREYWSGREIRLWRDELLKRRQAPFNTDSNSVVCAYYASAEIGCFLQLGWPLPENVLDLFVEHKLSMNGIPAPPRERKAGTSGKAKKGEGRDSLLGALAIRGLAHIDAGEKQAMRDLILSKHPDEMTLEERAQALDYCTTDVVGAEALLRYMIQRGEIDWPRALWRGRYVQAVAKIERCGVPLDMALHARLSANWSAIKHHLIAEANKTFPVFDEEDTFKEDRFVDYVIRHDQPWPVLPSGQLALDDDTFDDMCRFHPQLRPLYEVRASLGKMRLTGLAIGPDGRNRCMLSVFQSVTGRNQPSNNRFIFGPARWMRGLIKPPPGYAVAYVDWKSQEIAIAAMLSGDERLLEAYLTGDVYVGFAKQAGLMPDGATKENYPQFDDVRDVCKAIILGIGYGMGSDALAVRAGLTKTDAANLIRIHRHTYKKFWQWVENTTAGALFTGRIAIASGWRRLVLDNPNIRSLQNWPVQSTGAEMMRQAVIAATDAGLAIGAPVHDALLLVSAAKTFEQDLADLQAIMSKAGEAVIGLPVPTDAKLVWAAGEMPPARITTATTKWELEGRYMDKRGAAMWELVMKRLQDVERAVA
jgi:DNA polymerase I